MKFNEAIKFNTKKEEPMTSVDDKDSKSLDSTKKVYAQDTGITGFTGITSDWEILSGKKKIK